MTGKTPSNTCEHPDGCPRPKHKGRRYCLPHVNRICHTGSLGPVEIRPKAKSGEGHTRKTGYIEDHQPSHPLATKNGKLLRHRAVLFDSIGWGPHQCRWCERELEWQVDLYVDHLDFDKANNDLSNLVPSCDSCNVKRFNVLVRYILENNVISKEVLRCLEL